MVSNLVNEVTKPMEHLWFTREITICKKLPEDLELLADPFLIKQALTNLLQNAAEFSPEKGTINISAGKKDRCIFLTVEDQGPGIPDYAISRVFDKFYSLPRPETKNKSTGLGLNFVREIASLHKGSITLENKDTGGARAIINIPDKPHK